jgi:hypothetical protein
MYSWNRRGRFLVVVTDFGVQSPEILATNITEILWENYKISNSLMMIPTAFQPNSTNRGREYSLNLYSWFPYESGECGTFKEVVLLHRCVLRNYGCLFTDISLFPSKVPLNIHGCPLRISTWEAEPNTIQIHTTEPKNGNGSEVYDYRGVEIEFILLLSKAMNMSVEFLAPPPVKGYLLEFYFHALTSILDGKADIAIGHFPLHYLPLSYGEPTVPYTYTSFRWYVPCARAVRRVDSIMNLFTASAWLVSVLVLVLSAILFWGIANSPCRRLTEESSTYKTLSKSFNNVWAVLVGVSVAQMPRTFRLRAFFSLFVCYSFAMNTIFQAFFTSFLIEPRYEKQIQTFDEIILSRMTFLAHPSMDELSSYINYDEYVKLKSRQENCNEYKNCMLRYLEGERVVVMVTDLWAEYFASSVGRYDNGKKPLCTIDGVVFSMGLTMYLYKGHLLLDRFNVLIQRCLEAGLGQKYWSELTWNVSLNKSDKYNSNETPSGSDMYSVFTLIHLRIAFCLLAFGGALSFVVFLAELLSTRSQCVLNVTKNTRKYH